MYMGTCPFLIFRRQQWQCDRTALQDKPTWQWFRRVYSPGSEFTMTEEWCKTSTLTSWWCFQHLHPPGLHPQLSGNMVSQYICLISRHIRLTKRCSHNCYCHSWPGRWEFEWSVVMNRTDRQRWAALTGGENNVRWTLWQQEKIEMVGGFVRMGWTRWGEEISIVLCTLLYPAEMLF